MLKISVSEVLSMHAKVLLGFRVYIGRDAYVIPVSRIQPGINRSIKTRTLSPLLRYAGTSSVIVHMINDDSLYVFLFLKIIRFLN